MLPSFRSLKTFSLSLALACAGAHAWDWVPSNKQGAQIANVYYGVDDVPNSYGGRETVLKLTLQGVGQFEYYGGDYQQVLAIFQSLVQAKGDSLPVILYADTSSHLFGAVLIGTVDPDFPLALGDANGRQGAQAKIGMGYDLLGRNRSLAEAARAPLFIRPAAQGNSRRPAR
ncbi:MAG: hypothetical protein JF616_21750 [Fibrobacteres bacterium]|nr:hypothetical protein [Fibrobacterota bacterium]